MQLMLMMLARREVLGKNAMQLTLMMLACRGVLGKNAKLSLMMLACRGFPGKCNAADAHDAGLSGGSGKKAM